MAVSANYDRFQRAQEDFERMFSDTYTTSVASEGSELTGANLFEAINTLKIDNIFFGNTREDLDTVKAKKKDVKYGFICKHCHKYAFYTTKMPKPGDYFSRRFVYITGEYPEEGALVYCQNCKYPLGLEKLASKNLFKVDYRLIP